jgi:hypothetical protein
MEANIETGGTKKIAAIVALIILFAAVFTAVYFVSRNVELKRGQNTEKLKNETLLSEKLALDKEIIQFKDEISLLNGKNAQTDKLLAETRLKLSEKEQAIARLQKENATVKGLKKQLADLREMHEDFMHQITVLKMQNETMESENKKLQNSIASLENEKDDLMKQVELAQAESIMKADNYQVDVSKNINKEKLTVKAKRTKKMSVIVDVPKEMAAGVSFNLTTPDGKVITEKSKTLSWKVVNSDQTLTASLNPLDDNLIVTHQVKLTYTPTSKLKPGVYKIGILNKGKNIGNCRVQLR